RAARAPIHAASRDHRRLTRQRHAKEYARAAPCYDALRGRGRTSVDQTIINLYDRFTHGGMSRREFLDRLAELAGSTAAAAPLLQNAYAQAAIVAADDARLAAERVSYESPKGKINGYLVRGKALGKRPAVIVIHENRGLNPHIEDVARRLAVEGYLALAPDL